MPRQHFEGLTWALRPFERNALLKNSNSMAMGIRHTTDPAGAGSE